MPSEWYYLKDEKQEGPVSSDGLKKLAADGTLDPEDYIWKEGMEDWVPAKRLKGLPFPGMEKKAAAKSVKKTDTQAKAASAQKTAAISTKRATRTSTAEPKEQPTRQPAAVESSLVLPDQESASDDGLMSLDQATNGDSVVSMQDATTNNDDLIPLDEAVVNDDAVPIDQAVDEPVPIDEAVDNDDAVPIEQAVTPVQDSVVPIDHAVAPSVDPQPQGAQHRSAGLPYIRPGLTWSALLAAGAGLLVVAFVSPWWGFTMQRIESRRFVIRDQELRQTRDAAYAAQRSARNFYQKKRSEFGVREYGKSYWIWGWHTGDGIAALILGLVIASAAIVFSAVRRLTNWAWIVRFASIIPGVLMFILGLIWLFDTPSENLEPYLKQGVILGPYFCLLGSLILLIAGIAGGVAGVRQFNHARRLRRGYSY